MNAVTHDDIILGYKGNTSFQYGYLSNMEVLKTPIRYKSLEWDSSECLYQALKLANPEDYYEFSRLGPYEAKREIANRKKRHLSRDQLNSLMLFAIRRKFAANRDLADRLISTNDLIIVEYNQWNDINYGISAASKQGDNHQGYILMMVRDEIRNKIYPQHGRGYMQWRTENDIDSTHAELLMLLREVN